MPLHQSKHPLRRNTNADMNIWVGGGGQMAFLADLKKLPDDVYRELTLDLSRIATRLGVSPDQCGDMAQEALLHAFKHTEQFRGQTLEDLRSWLAAIVHNVAVDALRRNGRHSCQSLDAMRAVLMDGREANRADIAEWSECLVRWLTRLQSEAPGDCRLVCGRYLEARTIPEMAEETGRTAHEISCHLHRGLQKLRSWASQAGFHGEDLV
jgi:RNA polymerase sigma factor (sigma-70 family)